MGRVCEGVVENPGPLTSERAGKKSLVGCGTEDTLIQYAQRGMGLRILDCAEMAGSRGLREAVAQRPFIKNKRECFLKPVLGVPEAPGGYGLEGRSGGLGRASGVRRARRPAVSVQSSMRVDQRPIYAVAHTAFAERPRNEA